jgi:uncharacterized membrane protein (UPF0127 family)
MKISATILTLLFSSLLLVAGCGGEEDKAPSETSGETVPATTAPAAEPETAQTPTLNIINSEGEGVEVEVEIADTNSERARGLMERTELAEDAGMLFTFEQEQTPGFYMRDSLIPLSIAFIDEEGRIVDLQDMQPLDETRHYPAEPAKYALEVNQGFFAEHGVEVGNMVQLPEPPSSASPPSSTEVVQAFRDAGLEIGESYPVEQEPGWDEKPVPRTYEEATRFTIPSLGEDAGGRVFVFGSEGDLAVVRDYYEGLERSVRPYVYDEGLVLVQISNQLPEDEAEKYWTVLKEAV